MDVVESLSSWVTQDASAAAAAAAAAANRPVRAHSGASDPGPASTPSADFKKLVGSVESRLDGLLEDRRRRKQLEEQVAVQAALLSQLQAELADERRRRHAAEQQLAALSALLADKLEDAQDVPALGAAAAEAPWPTAGGQEESGAVAQLPAISEATAPAVAEAAGDRAVQGSALRLPEVRQTVQAAAGDEAQVQHPDTNTGAEKADGLVTGLAGVAAAPAAASASLDGGASAASDRGPAKVVSDTAAPAAAAGAGALAPTINKEVAVKQEAADAAAERQ
jgi:uncharacterized coiled-coil protein SlyX